MLRRHADTVEPDAAFILFEVRTASFFLVQLWTTLDLVIERLGPGCAPIPPHGRWILRRNQYHEVTQASLTMRLRLDEPIWTRHFQPLCPETSSGRIIWPPYGLLTSPGYVLIPVAVMRD